MSWPNKGNSVELSESLEKLIFDLQKCYTFLGL